MGWLEDGERKVLEAVAALADGNPFLPERVEAERSALGGDFASTGAAVWHVEADLNGLNPNVPKLAALVDALGGRLRDRLAEGARADRAELRLYQRLILYLLYQRYEPTWMEIIVAGAQGRPTDRRQKTYPRFKRDVEHYLGIGGVRWPEPAEPAHLFALGYQIRRAFHHVFRQIYGGSMPAARLRAAVWQSIFTHDSARYRRGLYAFTSDIATLIVGESGTGKELVARAVALSRYIPFDEERQAFVTDYPRCFTALNLSALSRPLIESELFGHRRGAFTGALEDRVGWLESCPAEGAVFLDEIGELDPEIQVKLLRVLQARTLQRIGESEERRFPGKIIAATNRDLAEEMDAGRFRTDFYYRLCPDQIRTPTLREQLDDRPEELADLTLILARRIAGPEEGERLADEVVRFATKTLGRDYPWPGNVRELEQCVRSVLVRGEYTPPDRSGRSGGADLAEALLAGELSAEDLLRRYCTLVYARVGSYEEAARRLGLDRRTVKARIDQELLESLRGDNL